MNKIYIPGTNTRLLTEHDFIFDGITGPDEEDLMHTNIIKVDAQTQTDNNEKSSDVLSTLVVIGIIYASYILFFN